MSECIACETCLYNKNCQFLLKHPKTLVEGCTAYKNAADFVEVRYGYWEAYWDDGYLTYYHRCSECKNDALAKQGTTCDQVLTSYCPHCGANMGGSRIDDDQVVEDAYCGCLNVPNGYTFEVGM